MFSMDVENLVNASTCISSELSRVKKLNWKISLKIIILIVFTLLTRITDYKVGQNSMTFHLMYDIQVFLTQSQRY